MKKSCMTFAAVAAGLSVFAGTATSYYHVTAKSGDVISVATTSQTEYPATVGNPAFWLDCSETNGWEIASDGKVTKACSRVGGRYLTSTVTYAFGFRTFNGGVLNKPTWSYDGEIGAAVVDFGESGSGQGLFFDAEESTHFGTNIVAGIRTVISVIDTRAGGGFFLGGGGAGGYAWHRGGSPDDLTNPLLYAEPIFLGYNNIDYPRYSRYWIDDLPNDPQNTGFSGGWAVTALEPKVDTTFAAGDAWGLGINDARASSVKRSGGFKVAEMLIYDKILTKEETLAVCAYLNRKWLKRTWRGMDGRAGLSWLTAQTEGTAAARVEIDVAEGDVLETDVIQGGRSQADGDPRIVKTGKGEITFPNAANYNGTVELKEGSLLFEAPRVAPEEMPRGLVARFDASAAETLETVPAGGVDYITRWTSTVDYKGGQAFSLIPVADDRRPYLAATTPFGADKPVVDFGPYVSPGRFFQITLNGTDKTGIPNVLTMLAVVDHNPGEVGSILNSSFSSPTTSYGVTRTSWFGTDSGYAGGDNSNGQPLSETDGPSYVNGVRHDPTDGLYHGGYSVVAKKSPGRKLSVQRIGCSLSNSSSTAAGGGGFRLAELLLFNRALTDEEIRDVSDKLSVKWFGRHTDAYRTAARGTASIQKLAVGGAGVTVNVASGTVARVGKVLFTAASPLVKEGEGTLEVEGLVGASPVSDLIVVRGGSVKMVEPPDPGEQTAVLAADPSFHLDATDTDKMILVENDGERKIAKWYDEDMRDAAAQATVSRQPFLNESQLQNGHPVVDFGAWGSADGRYLSFGRSYESVRAAFVVWMQNTDTGYPCVLASCSLNRDPENNDIYDFTRSSARKDPTTPYFDGNHDACAMVAKSPNVYTNGVAITASSSYPPVGEFRLVEVHTTGGAHVSGLGGDRSGNASFNGVLGGCRIGEVVLYERELTEREKVATRNYLMKKWFNADPEPLPEKPEPPAITNIAEIVAPDGKTTELAVDDAFSAERLTGTGAFVKSGAGELTVADVSGFGGMLAVESGTLRLTGGAPDESAALVTGGRTLHLDASAGISTETNGSGKVTVTSWKSVLDDGWEAVPLSVNNGTPVPPELFPRNLGGKDVVEMAFNRTQAFRFKKDGAFAILGNIHSVFWVIGSQNGGGWLLGGGTNALNGSQYPFHRDGNGGAGAENAKDALVNYSHAYAPLHKQASWYLNGAKVDPIRKGLSGGWDVVSMTIPAATEETYNYVNAGGLAHDGRCYTSVSYNAKVGNQRLAEVIIYDRELTAEERETNEKYLRRKWRLGVRGAVENDAMLVLAADATLDCGGVSQYFAALDGAGTVVNGTLETAKVAADAASAGLDVQGTFVIPEGLTVELRNLPTTGDLPMFIPILTAAVYEGRANLGTAVFAGQPSGAGSQYKLAIKRGILGAALPTGSLLIVR